MIRYVYIYIYILYIYIYPQLSPVLSSRRFLPAAPRSAARGLRCVDQAVDAATGRGGPARAAAAGEDGETLAGGAALIGMVGAGGFEAKLGVGVCTETWFL